MTEANCRGDIAKCSLVTIEACVALLVFSPWAQKAIRFFVRRKWRGEIAVTI